MPVNTSVEADRRPGIFAVRGRVNEGEFSLGDDNRRVVAAGAIPGYVPRGLQRLVSVAWSVQPPRVFTPRSDVSTEHAWSRRSRWRRQC